MAKLPPGAVILTHPDQIPDFKILGQVGESGTPGSYLYGTPKVKTPVPTAESGGSLSGTLTQSPTLTPPTPAGGNNSLAGLKSVLKSVTRLAFDQGPKPMDLLKQYAESGVNLTTPNAIGGAVQGDTRSRAALIGDRFDSVISLIDEQEKRRQEQVAQNSQWARSLLTALPENVLGTMSGEEFQSLQQGVIPDTMIPKIKAAILEKQKFELEKKSTSSTGSSGGVSDAEIRLRADRLYESSEYATWDEALNAAQSMYGGGGGASSFMSATSSQESGGNYNAQNARTGAFGKFQIMPDNWAPWSKEAGLPAGAQQTPENQEKVAQFKINQYYDKYGNWADVASTWYSGKPLSQVVKEGWADKKQGPNGTEPSVREYVNSVLAKMGETPVTGDFEDYLKQQQESAQQSFAPAKVEQLKKDFTAQQQTGASDKVASAIKSSLNKAVNGLPSTIAKRDAKIDINKRIAEGDIDGAKQGILQYARVSAGNTEEQAVTGRDVAITAITDIQNLLDEFIAKDGNTNIFSGTEEKILNKIGTTKDTDLANIAGQILITMQQFRSATTGKAFSEGEKKEYYQFFPSIGNVPELNTTRTKSLLTSLKRNQRTFYENQLGGKKNYDTIFAKDDPYDYRSNVSSGLKGGSSGTTASGLKFTIE